MCLGKTKLDQIFLKGILRYSDKSKESQIKKSLSRGNSEESPAD